MADSVDVVGDIKMALRRADKGYMPGVNAAHHSGSSTDEPEVSGTAENIARELEPVAWQRWATVPGTKGELMHDPAYLKLADLEADEFSPPAEGLWTRAHRRRRASLLRHMVLGRNADRQAGRRGRVSLDHR